MLLPLPWLGSLDASPGVEGVAEGPQHGESGWGLFSIRKRERTIVRKRRETNREHVCCCSLLGLALLTRPQADGSCWGSLGWRVAFGGGGGGKGGGRIVEKQGKEGLRRKKKGRVGKV